jgi:hypothetical protein
MPKDEFDPEDPMELCGVGLLTREDTSATMAECFVEEFMRLGYSAGEILGLFRNPRYTGMNMVLQNRGELFVKNKIAEVFGWWQCEVTWTPQPVATAEPDPRVKPVPAEPTQCDPTGAAVPNLEF